VQRADLPQRVDQFLGKPIGKIHLTGIAAQIGESHDRDRMWWRRESRWLLQDAP